MKLVYKLLDFIRGNKRKKSIKKPLTQKQIRANHYNAAFDRAIRKEREIGVHPKYRNRQSDYSPTQVKNWELLEKEWEKKNV